MNVPDTQSVFVLTTPNGERVDEFDTEQSAYEFAESRIGFGEFTKLQCRTGLWHNKLLPDNRFLVDNISDEVLWTYPEDN